MKKSAATRKQASAASAARLFVN